MSPWPVYWLVFCKYGVIYKYEPRPLVEYLSQSPAPYKIAVVVVKPSWGRAAFMGNKLKYINKPALADDRQFTV